MGSGRLVPEGERLLSSRLDFASGLGHCNPDESVYISCLKCLKCSMSLTAERKRDLSTS